MAIIGQTPNEGAWQYSRGNWDTTYDSSGERFVNNVTGIFKLTVVKCSVFVFITNTSPL